jgi:hypothetical protein
LPHLRQALLGGNTAVHYPDALSLAVLRLDLAQKIRQRCAIGGVPSQVGFIKNGHTQSRIRVPELELTRSCNRSGLSPPRLGFSGQPHYRNLIIVLGAGLLAFSASGSIEIYHVLAQEL